MWRDSQRHGVKPVDTFHEEEGYRFHAMGLFNATSLIPAFRMNSNLPWRRTTAAFDAISFLVESAEQHAIYDSAGHLDG